MRQGWTIVPAGLVLVVALMGAGGGGEAPAPPGDWAAMTDERFGLSIAPIYLVLRPDVQGDLKLDRKQVDGATEVVGRLIDKLLAIKGKPAQAAETDPRREIDEMMAKWLHEALDRRPARAAVAGQPAMGRRLGDASPVDPRSPGTGRDPARRIHQILADRDQLNAKGKLGPAEFDRRSRDAMAVLGPMQRRQWDELLGPPCRFVVKGQPRTPAR